MTSEDEPEELTFFEYIDSLAAEKGISRDSIEYTRLIESRQPLYILTHDLGQEELRRLAIWDIQKIIRHVCEEYEEKRQETLESVNRLGLEDFEPEEISEFNARYLVGNQLLLAYTLAREFISDITEEIAREQDLHTTEKNVSEMDLKTVVEQLHDAEVISDDLKDHIDHVVARRNALAHEIDQRYTLSKFEDDLVKETSRPLYAVDGLFLVMYGEHAYIPAKESE